MHLLSLPGRGTKEANWQCSNSVNSRWHLFLYNGRLVTLSNYHKGSYATGIFKSILRVMPSDLGRIFGVLLRVVRPVEVVVVLQFHAKSKTMDALAKKTVVQAIEDTYRTYIFVTRGSRWTSPHLSALIKSWFSERLGADLGMNLHRHFAQSLQRQFLSYPTQSPLRSLLIWHWVMVKKQGM
jgi:hypothetical protein